MSRTLVDAGRRFLPRCGGQFRSWTKVDFLANASLAVGHLIRAILDGVEQVATEYERKWGIGRLRLLVSDLPRAKFDAQLTKLDAAVASNVGPHVEAHAEGMRSARRRWRGLRLCATRHELGVCAAR